MKTTTGGGNYLNQSMSKRFLARVNWISLNRFPNHLVLFHSLILIKGNGERKMVKTHTTSSNLHNIAISYFTQREINMCDVYEHHTSDYWLFQFHSFLYIILKAERQFPYCGFTSLLTLRRTPVSQLRLLTTLVRGE